MLRQCFPRSPEHVQTRFTRLACRHILLGPIERPLASHRDSCSLQVPGNHHPLSQDITDDSSATIRACLCHSDFCNAGHLGPHHQLTSVEDLPPLENPVNPLPLVLRQPKQQSDHSRIPQTSTSTDLPGNGVLSSSTARPLATRMTTQPVTEEPRRGPGRRIPSFSFPEEEDKTDTFPDVLVDKNTAVSGPLKCFSCGSLFHPDRKCDEFDITSPMQVRELGG